MSYFLLFFPLGILDSDIIEGPSRISLNCPIRYATVLVAYDSNIVITFFAAFFWGGGE